MDNSIIPPGYQRVMPYIIVPGAEAFMDFLHKVFGAEEKLKLLHDNSQIMHAEMTIGDSTIMLADSNDQWGPDTAGLFVYVDNADHIYSLALEHGASSVMTPSDRDYGRACGVKDMWGNTWWITSQG